MYCVMEQQCPYHRDVCRSSKWSGHWLDQCKDQCFTLNQCKLNHAVCWCRVPKRTLVMDCSQALHRVCVPFLLTCLRLLSTHVHQMSVFWSIHWPMHERQAFFPACCLPACFRGGMFTFRVPPCMAQACKSPLLVRRSPPLEQDGCPGELGPVGHASARSCQPGPLGLVGHNKSRPWPTLL